MKIQQKFLLIVGIALVVSGIAVTAHAGEQQGVPPRTSWMRNPCPQEDSMNCQWNTGNTGDRPPYSFYAVTRPLLSYGGQRIGKVDCHFMVNHHGDRLYSMCQARSRRVIAHRPLFWQRRMCSATHPVNCMYPANGVNHARYVRQVGDRVCVFNLGSRQYANRHDYCA